jgi:hypothetical protein
MKIRGTLKDLTIIQGGCGCCATYHSVNGFDNDNNITKELLKRAKRDLTKQLKLLERALKSGRFK